MIKRYALPVLSFFLGVICLSLTPGNNENNRYRSPNKYVQNMRPAVSNENNESQQPRQATGREEIAYMDERDRDIHERANRKGDWGYKQNWRYDRQAFYRGETQGEAYDLEHPDGIGGPGLDQDKEFLEMRQYYLENRGKNEQNPANYQRQNRVPQYQNERNSNVPGYNFSQLKTYQPDNYSNNGYN